MAHLSRPFRQKDVIIVDFIRFNLLKIGDLGADVPSDD